MQQNKVGEPKLFKLFGHFSLALLIGVSSVNAQSFENFKRSQAESFQQYKDERDSAFSKHLKQQWKAYSVHIGESRYEKPKPTIVPSTPQTKIKSVGPKVNINVKKLKNIEPKDSDSIILSKKVITTPLIVVSQEKDDSINKIKIVETIKKVKPATITPKDIKFDFFGSKLGFDIPAKIKSANFYPQNQKGITSFFSRVASSEYDELIKNIDEVSDAMNLNDWGRYLLVLKVSSEVYRNSDNSKLLSWFIFNKLGYAVKVGLSNKHVILMHYSKKTIYSTPNYSFSNRKFYVLSHYAKGNLGRIFSYKQDYPGSTKALDLSLNTLPFLESDMRDKTLSFKEYGKTYEVSYQYNQNLIDFMETYPQADYETFFNAPIDSRTYKSIATALKKYLDGKKAGDAMNFVLHFVQKSFKYSKDNAQFNREKVMFAQETLYFDRSDCEDRAVLFSYLIKELFSISVYGVHYKGHMATALYVPMKGDYIRLGGKKLVIADPTYINSNIGQSMSQYRTQKPKNIISVK